MPFTISHSCIYIDLSRLIQVHISQEISGLKAIHLSALKNSVVDPYPEGSVTVCQSRSGYRVVKSDHHPIDKNANKNMSSE
jgi:hypothetical protein